MYKQNQSYGNRTASFRTFPSRQCTFADAGEFPAAKKTLVHGVLLPELENDMWRIAGLLFFNDKDHFADKSQKAFRKVQNCAFPVWMR